MARSFTSQEAKALLAENGQIVRELSDGLKTTEEISREIEKAANNMVAGQVMTILRGIPIEEISRYKKGFRLKALHEYGFHTIADVVGRSVSHLAAIRGISRDSAEQIKWIAGELKDKAAEGVKIRLSTDDRNEKATALVKALATYRALSGPVKECQTLLDYQKEHIQPILPGLEPGMNNLRWFFSSKQTKQHTEETYAKIRGWLDGDYGKISKSVQNRINSAKAINAEKAWEDFAANSVQFFNLLERILPGLLGGNDFDYGLPEDLFREVQEECFFPDGLLCELRLYQELGVKYILHQERVLLGDEMGLGKTVQAIAAMVSLRNTGETHFIVVCPASVLTNWCREIVKMSKLSVTKVHGTDRDASFRSWLRTGGVAVTTYETTRMLEFPQDFRYGMLVVDEAHYIKNENAQRSINVRVLGTRTKRMLFMTGTALENKVDEMISLIHVLRPDIARQLQGMKSLSSAPKFREMVAPVYYRRRREDVLAELPELIENQEWCTLSPAEEQAYRSALFSKNYPLIRRVSWHVENVWESSKAARLKELVEEAAEEGRKIIVFSFFLKTIDQVMDLFGSRCIGPINGSVSPQRRQEILDRFEKAPEGTVLAAQIQSGGTGLNIQSANVVVICEPQLKPSIENQAISRAYRMGQTRNVLVYRLLCENTVDERITEMLAEKQQIFDAFADKSHAAEAVEVDAKSLGNIIEEEIERIKKEQGITGTPKTEEPSHKTESPRSNSKRPEREAEPPKRSTERPYRGAEPPSRSVDHAEGKPETAESIRRKHNRTERTGYSVTGRIEHVTQPYGGFLPIASMEKNICQDGFTLREGEQLNSGLAGLAVDYLTRMQLGDNKETAFKISLAGAQIAGEFAHACELLENVQSLDDRSIYYACQLVGYDVCYRVGPERFNGVDAIDADSIAIDNIRQMAIRSAVFFGRQGRVRRGVTFGKGFTKTVMSGDADYLVADTLYDLKTSKHAPNSNDTLQILMYYLMGLHSGDPELERVKYLGIYNPRLNTEYKIAVDRIPKEVIREVEEDVLGYRR